jgi:hypothetical protein
MPPAIGRLGGCSLEDRLACHARQLGPHMPDHLEVRRHVLQLLGDIGADLAKTTTTSAAPTGLTLAVVLRLGGLRAMNVRLARQMRWQAAIDLWSVRGSGLVRRDGRRLFIQWCAFQKCHLSAVEALARTAEQHAIASQDLHLELGDEQLEACQLGVARIEQLLELFDSGTWRGRCRHGYLLCRTRITHAIGGITNAITHSSSGGQFGLISAPWHAPVDAFEQHRQLRRRQRHAA